MHVKDTALTALSRKEILIGQPWSCVFTVTREVVCPPCTGWGEYRAYQCCLNHMVVVVMVGCGGCDSPKKIQTGSPEGGRINVYMKYTDDYYDCHMGPE